MGFKLWSQNLVALGKNDEDPEIQVPSHKKAQQQERQHTTNKREQTITNTTTTTQHNRTIENKHGNTQKDHQDKKQVISSSVHL